MSQALGKVWQIHHDVRLLHWPEKSPVWTLGLQCCVACSCTSFRRLEGGEALGKVSPVSGWLPACVVIACVLCAMLHACTHSGSENCIWLHLLGLGAAKRWAEPLLLAAGWLSRQSLPHCMLGCLAVLLQGPLRPHVAMRWPTAT